MSQRNLKRESKTLTDIAMTEIKLIIEDSQMNSTRTQEVRNLISQMIELAHKRGRPLKEGEELLNAA